MGKSEEIIEKLKSVESESRKLDITDDWKNLQQKVLNYCDNHLETMDRIPAYVKEIGDGKNLSDFRIESKPKDPSEVLNILDKEITTPGLNPASGGHLGYIPGGAIPVSALGDYIAAVTNKYAGVFYGSPGAVRCENFLINWLIEIIGFPKTAFGNLASGGSISNLIAMIAARDANGMTGSKAEKGAIYLTPHAHHCIKKSINIAGLGCCSVRYIKQDSAHKMDVYDLKFQIEKDLTNGLEPFLVIGNAGTTDTGIVDPLDEIADICEEHKLWYHIDGAYGGFFVLLDEVKSLFKGIDRCDSIVLDPHKGLFLPYGLGAVLVRNKKHLTDSFSYEANYMQDAYEFDEQLSPANVSPELTKHFRGLRMWLPLQIHGLDVFKSCLLEKILLTRYFYEEVRKIGFETGAYPELSVTTYRYVPKKGDPDKFNQLLISEILNDGAVFVSSTNLNGNFVLRLAVLSFRTHLATIDTLLNQLKTATEKLINENPEFS